MQPPGYVFKNSGLTPPADEKVENMNAFEIEQANTIQNHTVKEKVNLISKSFTADSHELAHGEPEVLGAAQTDGAVKGGVRDIGWHKPSVEIPDPLIGGVPNGQLFSLIRRFNKDVFAVRSVPLEIAHGLDLNDAWEDKYATDKLTLHFQRAYIAIVLPLASFGKQIARLRSWKETRRTSAFCVAYFTAWIFDLLLPLCLATLVIVISSAKARDVLFPPAPRALVNSSTGAMQNPAAGKLGTVDTLTGAAEKEEGEAVEEEAAGFVSNIRHLIQRIVGMHENEGKDGDPLEGKIPKPIRNAVKSVKAQGSATGQATQNDDQTKEPMEKVLWSGLKPENLEPIVKAFPHVVGEAVDNFERFANALSPIPPFSRFSFIRMDVIIVPLFLTSCFVSSYMVYKGTGFAIGAGLFGDPVLSPALAWLNKNYPSWIQLLEPKNNIFRGVPTNSQIAITLLRIGEAHKTPLPPVPTSKPDDLDQPVDIDINDIPLDASPGEKALATSPPLPELENEDNSKDEPKHKHLSKISRIFKANTKAAVETKLAADHVLAAAGSEKSKGHLGVLPKTKNLIYAGPSHFKARFEGKKGWLYITETANPSLGFTTHDPRSESTERLEPAFEIMVKDMKELKRAKAFPNKAAEMAADFSSGQELLGSVEVDDMEGKTWRFTAVPERDELFNRLVAMGGQRWENL